MIALTGATGHLGQLVIENLLKRGHPAKEVVAVVRNKAKAVGLSALGVQVREADYASPEALEKAFAGVDRVLLISGSEVGQRLPQHQNVVNAAKKAQVKQLLYTSILKADTSKMQLANEHLATEKAIRSSGIPFVFLRNGWYIDNYTGQLPHQIPNGAIAGSAKEGRISAAARADYAEAAATALIGPTKDGAIYELGGTAFTMKDYAKAVAEISGKKFEYQDMPEADYAKLLVSLGVPEAMANALADSDVGIVRGDLFTESQDLVKLIGHPLIPLHNLIKDILKA